MDALGFFVHFVAYYLILMFGFSMIFLLFKYIFDFLGFVTLPPVVLLIAGIIFILGMLGISYVARNAAQKREVEGENFWEALASTLFEVWFQRRFFPVIGRFFDRGEENNSRYRNPPDQ